MPPRRRSSTPVLPVEQSEPASPAAPASTASSFVNSLAIWPVRVAIGGRHYQVPQMAAAYWVAALIDRSPGEALIDLLDPQDSEDLTDRVLDGEITFDMIIEALLDLVSTLSGRSWWFTMRLLSAVGGSWDTVGGYLALHGVDASRMPLQAYVDAVLAAALRHVEEKKQVSFLAQLKAPPAGQKPAIDEKAEEAIFFAQMRG